MNRKLFLKKIATSLFLGIPLISMWSCSDSDVIPIPGPGTNVNCLANGTNSSIGSIMDIHCLYLQQMLPLELKKSMIFKEALRTVIK